METAANNDSEIFGKSFAQNLSSASGRGEVLMTYDGTLNPEAISKLETEIEGKILDKSLSKTAVKKVFFICIESLQNMFIHGYTDNQGYKHNYFILYITADRRIKMICANLIANAAIEKIAGRIEKINSFTDPADLKTYYLQHLENNTLSDKGGAGLGFITIGMKSGNKLRAEFEKINNDRSVFLMEATINAD